jgi:hypothetical protein
MIDGAPRWAEGSGRPRSAPPGTWKPNPSALAAFAKAAARRYLGRVRYWQIWNEPNLDVYLTPQWTRTRGRYTASSPVFYRRMLNASYRALKVIDGSNIVVTAGTSPFGEPRVGGTRIPPARFVRELLCLGGRSLRLARCPNPAHFDVLAHHPYALHGPRHHDVNPDDVSVSDLGRLTRPLRTAERTGRALPRRRKGLWVTEMSWDSSPPDPWGVPAATQANWLEDSLRILWTEGVSTVMWFNVVDQAPVPNYWVTTQSGIYERSGVKKPSWTAFRFPFAATRHGRRSWDVWLRAPVRGRVVIQAWRRGSWRPIAAVAVHAHQIVRRRVRPGAASRLRAAMTGIAASSGMVTLPWRTGSR